MEVELGDKKIKRRRDEDDDESDECELRIGREREQQVLWYSRETPSMFILSAHLLGYKRNSVEIINIKEEGRDQTLTNEEKPIQKLVITGEPVRKNQEEISGFRKVFKIPNGVVPDQIKAKYSEEESVLEICMPKFVKQICGVQIEEVKEEEFGESSHKVINEFKVHLIENPNRVLEIRNKYGESDDRREEDDKEETEVKNSEAEKNVGEENQEVSSNKNIVIQSLEESDNGVLGREVNEEVIGCRKEKEIEDTEEESVEEDISKVDRIEGRKLREIEESQYEIEDRDVEVKEGTEESLQMKTSNSFLEWVVAEEEFENIKGGSNEKEENGKEGFEEAMETNVKELPQEQKEPLQVDELDITEGEEQTASEEPHAKDETCKEGSQAKKKVEAFEATVENEEKGKAYNNESGNQESQDSDVKLLRSSQPESPLGPHNNDVVIGQKEYHGGYETEVEVIDEHGDEVQREISQEPDGLKDIQVEGGEEEKANEQRDGVYVEISNSKQVDQLEDVQVEAREEDIINAKEQRDQVYVEISQVEERRESQLKENEEKKKLHGPLLVVGSAFILSLVVLFVRHRRVDRK